MTPTQTYSVQNGNPLTAKDSKPRLIPEIKQKMRAGKSKNKTTEININNRTETGLNTHRFMVGMVSHLSRRFFLSRDNKILSVKGLYIVNIICFFAHFQIYPSFFDGLVHRYFGGLVRQCFKADKIL